MEKFEIDRKEESEVFNSFTSRAKDALTTLIDSIKSSVKDYETKIEETEKEIEDNEQSREKCEHEITKMEGRIEEIKDAIENVENTYKRIVDAYSSTSKGETKDLYSDIIEGAKANCDKDVEKNRSEIARLNSDIEAIKNNISEFTKIIEGLNRDLENYKLELFKYNKAAEYMENSAVKISTDLEDISIKKDTTEHKAESKSSTKKAEPKRTTRSTTKQAEKTVEEEPAMSEEETESIIDAIEKETFKTEEVKEEEPIKEEIIEEPKQEDPVIEPPVEEEIDPLKQIYDLTGYQPASKEEETIDNSGYSLDKEEPIKYTENLDNLFSTPTPDVVEPTGPKFPSIEESNDALDSILNDDFSNWESILNTPTPETKEESNTTSKEDSIEDTVDQLLTPYGTTFERLSKLVGNKITYKDGSSKEFDMSKEDVIKAVNEVDGNDLKLMKTIGPEITLLRKIKNMKEGK